MPQAMWLSVPVRSGDWLGGASTSRAKSKLMSATYLFFILMYDAPRASRMLPLEMSRFSRLRP